MGRFKFNIPEKNCTWDIVCPYCKQKYYIDEDAGYGATEYECEECGGYFEVLWKTQIVYSTEKRSKPEKTNERK